jgi:DNA-binding transcriptional LysR family regulator
LTLKRYGIIPKHELEALVAVASHRRFTRAAEALCVTQTAVTQQIAGLAAELGMRLLDRLGRTVRLTASGEAMYGHAEPILRLKREVRDRR